MFGFFLKKNLCDVWDNVLHFFVVNLVIMAVAVAGFFLCLVPSLLPLAEAVQNILFYICIFVSLGFLFTFIFAECDNCAKVANFGTPNFKNYFSKIGESFKDGFLFGFLVSILALVTFVALPYYFHMWIPEDGSQGSIIGLLLASVVFWIVVITVLALQWFAGIRSILKNPFFKTLKKCYILFFDNTGFTILMFFKNIFNVLLSVLFIVTFCSVPGISSITLSSTNAFRLRLYKYDWMEVNPELSPKELKDVPWKELLEKDKNTLGPRKFKSFLFPWKD